MTRLSQPAANKYHAVKTWSELCHRTFDSKVEAKRGEELALLERAGEIADLEYQPRFVLCKKPKITYTADFRYWDKGGFVIVEDVKGCLLRETRVKLAWLEQSQILVSGTLTIKKITFVLKSATINQSVTGRR